MLGDVIGEFFFTVFPDDPCQVFFGIRIYNVFRAHRAVAVHPHVQRSIFFIRKAALRIVDLIGGNSDIKQDAVDLFDV